MVAPRALLPASLRHRMSGARGVLGVLAAALLFAAATALTIQAGYFRMFSFFASWDDEGYMLVSLRSFRAIGALYTEVYTQYGPAYFVAMDLLFDALGLEVTHDNGRLVTLALWVASSLACGVAAWRYTRSLGLGLFVQLLVFRSLFVQHFEPMHPGGLLCLLLSGLTVLPLLHPSRPRLAAALLGVGLASLALIKINVGVFALVATGFGFAASAPALARYRAVLLAAGAAIVAAPLALMWPAMDQPWARGYALHVAAAALGVVIALLSLGPDETLRPAQLAWWAAGAGGLALVVCGAVLLRGTRPADLFDAVLVRPFGQAAALTIPMRIPSQGKAIALVGLGLCVGAAIRSNRGGRGASLIEGLLRLGAGLAIAITAAGLSPTTGLFTHTPPGLLMAPLAWVAVLEPRGLESPNALKVARRLLPPLAVLQALHAYPVAGLSQVRWGSFLLIPLGAIAIADGARQIAQAMSSEAARGWPWRLAGQVASLALLAIGLRGVLVHMHQERALYESNVPLALPGAGRLRIPEAEAQPLRAVVADLRERCTTHIALPTLGSLYLWAQQEPPTPANNTTWMFLFDAPLQERIVERLRGIDRLCAVQSPGLAEVFTRGRPIPPRPLAVYFASAFTPVAQHGPFTLMVRR